MNANPAFPGAALALALIAAPAMAQDAATVMVEESEEYGQHLVDGDGRALYLFTTDTRGEGDTEAQISCTSQECLENWPLFTTQGEPQAGENADASLLGTIQYEGESVVTYNGWPLYYFVRDQGEGEATGQDIASFGGEWYLLTPQGEPVGH